MTEVAVLLRGVCRTYEEGVQEHPVLTGIDAGFLRGSFVAIRGRSGSGKSTLLNLIAGIDLPDAGEIHVHGQVINHLSERQRTLLRRRSIGFVFQSFNLIPTLTVLENVTFPLEMNGVGGKPAEQQARGILERLALADREATFPDQLSGGEQQRVAIARAVIHAPSLILADEPTGNLDLDTGQQVLGLLRELCAEQRVCLLCATHSDEVTALADEVWELSAGQIRQL